MDLTLEWLASVRATSLTILAMLALGGLLGDLMGVVGAFGDVVGGLIGRGLPSVLCGGVSRDLIC